ncbi:uncharacterized protein LOC126750284 isoform X2 [Anthonomus grandis grandis]|uniref:uncharacterized protein LOC126750284 isoform X2 n=1 Tax=Anthonomus grandis grandis TaxID=2921223 RepID=UPI002164F0DB|nr:uncharacterized protein LOC126750284 isoform X2 [Anthonomus grandis grandis]
MNSYKPVHFVIILVSLLHTITEAGAGTTKTKDMFAHVDTTARLPCPVNPGLCGKLHSVKWYKDTSRIYVLSHSGTIRRPEGDAKERMKVEYPTDSGQAILQIEQVQIEDEAIYKCEITYIEVKESCHEVVQIVNLTTLVSPKEVKVMKDNEVIKNGSILGPKEEGDEVDLVCEAGPGKPTPRVNWYNGTTLISRAQYKVKEEKDGRGTGISKLQLTLSRGDLKARFECRVESEALEEPIVSFLTADVHVKPTSMKLTGPPTYTVQGSNVMIMCDVFGARPPAKIRWTNGSVAITNETLVRTDVEHMKDGTYNTKSQFVFQASHYENGIKIHCYAENEVTKHKGEPEGHQVLILEVRYAPVILVRPKYITVNESTNNTLLICSYKANPQELKGASWTKDDKELNLTDEKKYKGGTIENPPLIIYNVTREDMGEYTCWLQNEIRMEKSEDTIYLNVQYTPDVEVLMDPATPVKALDKTNVMLLCNVTSGNPGNLSKVRWFLDGELMKEFPECNYTAKDGGPFCGLDPSILSLERVDETFAGNYTCQGENVAGWGPISEPVELVVYYPPSPAKIRSYPTKVIKGAEVNLECKVESPGRPDNVTYIWHRGSHQMTEVTSAKLKIAPVGLETNSNFTCIAVNEGGQSEPATLFVNVNAPPALFDRWKTYQGILYSAEQINLTCRVECSPLCKIVWKKNGKLIDFDNDPLYYNKTVIHEPDLQKNMFESIESTLIWNMTAWPGNKLNRTAPNTNYTCQSESNQIGPGVSSTIEIAVDYPPEDVRVSTKVVNVVEGQAPSPVKCTGKGHPNLNYRWKRNQTAEAKENGEELRLGPMVRSDSGTYICEGYNKHGAMTDVVYFNVMYAPECSITRTKRDSSPALLCTVQANPQEVSFFWKVREGNETYNLVDSNYIQTDGLKSYLILDSTVDTKRTYQCFANNSVGFSDKQPCEMDVAGILPWWKRLTKENLYIIIASIIAIIICVIIICIVIIILCRRKRAGTKYNNPLEMEEREKPEGSSCFDQSKWPLKPGVLVHISKMNNINISQLNPRMSPFKTTSVKTSAYLKYRRRQKKVYARLKGIKEALGLSRHDRPFGIKEGPTGVVTFKKIQSSPNVQRVDGTNTRKRKKPGDAPVNPSSIVGDKIRPGVVRPVGNMKDHPLTKLPEPSDEGFYENLPFHGMSQPPNKPMSIIAPFNHNFNPTLNSPLNQSLPLMPQKNPAVKRNQSFHGFQSTGIPRRFGEPQLPWATQYSIFMKNITSQTLLGSTPNVPFLPFLGSQSFGVNPAYQNNQYYQPLGPIGPKSSTPRVEGRNEASFELKRSASLPKEKPKKPTLVAKRFNSLKTEKHKCYSPTFYSMRCKKHAKKRPIVYALPKKCLNHLPKKPLGVTKSEDFQNLTDSIQILEQSSEGKQSTPVPAPRCKKHKRPDIIYANICDSLQTHLETSSSSDTSKAGETSIIQAEVHTKEETSSITSKPKIVDHSPKLIAATPKQLHTVAPIPKISSQAMKNSPVLKVSPNFIKPKVESPKGALSLKIQAKRKSSPEVQSPTEMPKISLVRSVEEEKKMSNVSTQSRIEMPKIDLVRNDEGGEEKEMGHGSIQSPTEMPKINLVRSGEKKEGSCSSSMPKINVTWISEGGEEKKKSPVSVPKMPLLKPKSPNDVFSAASENAFYTLTAPHCKQTVLPPQYSATIPHPQKHTKLIPKALFQEQLAKSKSFSSKSSKQKRHFQIPLQKCHSFKFQTAESYFQPIKNIHEENLMRNGYMSDYPASSSSTSSLHHKRQKPKQKTKGPLVLRHASDYKEQFPENIQSSVQLQYPQPINPGRGPHHGKPNGVVQYADLDMSDSRKSSSSSSSKSHSNKKQKPKTEYATLRFNEVGQEIDV